MARKEKMESGNRAEKEKEGGCRRARRTLEKYGDRMAEWEDNEDGTKGQKVERSERSGGQFWDCTEKLSGSCALKEKTIWESSLFAGTTEEIKTRTLDGKGAAQHWLWRFPIVSRDVTSSVSWVCELYAKIAEALSPS
jgi:hypothetical protein